MPYKDPTAAAAARRAHYLANRGVYLERSKQRRLRVQADRAAKKAEAALLPTPPTIRACAICGKDITEMYVPKHGPRCKLCVAEYQRQYRAANRARIAASKKQWVGNNREHVRSLECKYAVTNADNKRAARKKWVAENPGKDTASKARNTQNRRKRLPSWLSPDDLWMIEQAYELAALRTKMFGFPWHVDHILPLNGRTVSGLHVPTNLQVIPGIENLRKSNRTGVAQ